MFTHKTGIITGLICNFHTCHIMLSNSYIKSIAALLMLLVAAVDVWAHPGHGETAGHSVLHYLIEPFHVLPMISVVVLSVVIFIVMYVRRKRRTVTHA